MMRVQSRCCLWWWIVLLALCARGQDEEKKEERGDEEGGDMGGGTHGRGVSSSATTLATFPNNATTEASRFLKHGDSYDGRVATRVIELADASVAVLLTIDNWSKWALVDPVVTMECGRLVENPAREDLGVPAVIKPGYSEMILFEKNSGLSGVCGVLSFTLEVELDETPDYIQVMFSVPYNLNTYGAYYAVGISQDYTNNSTEIFEDLYYYTGPFRRAEAGKMITFSSQRVLLRGQLTPDTYKPILSLVVLPLDKEHRFVPGEYYSPRLRASACKVVASLYLIAILTFNLSF